MNVKNVHRRSALILTFATLGEFNFINWFFFVAFHCVWMEFPVFFYASRTPHLRLIAKKKWVELIAHSVSFFFVAVAFFFLHRMKKSVHYLCRVRPRIIEAKPCFAVVRHGPGSTMCGLVLFFLRGFYLLLSFLFTRTRRRRRRRWSVEGRDREWDGKEKEEEKKKRERERERNRTTTFDEATKATRNAPANKRRRRRWLSASATLRGRSRGDDDDDDDDDDDFDLALVFGRDVLEATPLMDRLIDAAS